ncbi:MAG: hypothetical protein KBD51_00925 [Candidatus Levybacteria bacterium]|nr:hypothetical protein [Candidatus Levybacteria bacterium]
MPILDLLYISKWWIVFFFLGITFLPLTSKIFSSFIDKGYIFSKVFGMVFISYIIYVLGSFQLLKFTTLNIFIIWFFCASISLFFLRKESFNLKKYLKIFLFEEIIFLFALIIWSFVRAHQPDIHDLEKFMDYGFINSILRSEYFPPRDMWLTPLSINYYYFGHLFTAVVTKISHVPAYITFNLMIATIFAFTFSLSFSIGINLIQQIKKMSLKKTFILGFVFAYIVSLSGNLQTIYSLFKNYEGESPVPFWDLPFSIFTFPNAYWYPNATRFIYHTIHEFPSYSFVVADLHGHVLDIPIVITLIAFAFLMFLQNKIKIPLLVLTSFFISIAYMTNAWDGLIYIGLFINILFVLEFINNKNKSFLNRFLNSFLRSIRYIPIIGTLFFVFTFVFSMNFAPFASEIGINCAPKLLLDIKNLGPFVFETGQCQHSPLWQLVILYGFFVFMLFGFFAFIRNKKINPADFFIGIISIFSILLLIAPEIIYLKDIYTGHFRANTMFKLAYQAFIMLSFSSIYILLRVIFSFKTDFKSRFSRISVIGFLAIGFILIFIVSIYPYFSVPSGYGDLKTYKGLNGTNYLKTLKPGDHDAIIWINQNIKGQPVILEAQGDSYTDFARISANTGLPTILGWTVHEWLWRGTYDVPAARFSDIQNLYESPDENLTKKIIDKYDISYVYIGEMEKEKYKLSEEKFSKLGFLIYARGTSRIYKIR